MTAQSAQIIFYTVAAAITTFSGPDSAVVMATALRALQDYVTSSHKLGRDITRSGILAALHVPGVQNVALSSPADGIIISRTQAPYRTNISVNNVGTGE